MGIRRFLAGRLCTKSNTRGKDVWLLSHFAHSLVRWFKPIGISVDAHDRTCNIRKQRQDKTIDLHAHIELAVLAHNCRCYTPQRFIPDDKNKNRKKRFLCVIFYFDPFLIPNATSQTHDVAAVFQLHRSTEN